MATFERGLTAQSRAGNGQLLRRLPKENPQLSCRIVEPICVLSLRFLAGGQPQLARALGGATLPEPGHFTDHDPFIVWRNSSEYLHIGTDAAAGNAVLRALPPDDTLTYAVDLSDGVIVLELQAQLLEPLLSRLLDASVKVREPRQGTRARLGELAVLALRISADRLWLIADRADDRYLARWIAYAADGAQSETPP
jgi:hypothetical protein